MTETAVSNGRATIREVIALLHEQDAQWSRRFERLEDKIDARFDKHEEEHKTETERRSGGRRWFNTWIITVLIGIPALISVVLLLLEHLFGKL